MEGEYWLQRWREGRTGWHHTGVMPLLEKHWPALDVPRGSRVLVPLAGKSLDMVWLAAQGLDVLGVELSPLAIQTFLEENHLQADRADSEGGTRHVVGNLPVGGIEVIQGDIFAIPAATLAGCTVFYDRAALIALPAPDRERLVRQVYAALAPGSRGLLITLDYPPHEMDGPPFSVDDAEVRRLFEPDWQIQRLEHRDILASQPDFSGRGITALSTSVYRLDKRAA